MVRQRPLEPRIAGSNPAAPANRIQESERGRERAFGRDPQLRRAREPIASSAWQAGFRPSIYGKGRDAQSVVLDPKALETLLHKSGAGLNTLIDLSVAGRTDTVLVKELQRHPVHGSFLHVDFFQVDLTQKITVSVPIHFVGKARGVEFGGILDHPLRELEVECLPARDPRVRRGGRERARGRPFDPRQRGAAARGRRGEDGSGLCPWRRSCSRRPKSRRRRPRPLSRARSPQAPKARRCRRLPAQRARPRAAARARATTEADRRAREPGAALPADAPQRGLPRARRRRGAARAPARPRVASPAATPSARWLASASACWPRRPG